jgi:hypothetical protein
VTAVVPYTGPMRIVLVVLVLAGCATTTVPATDASMPPADGFVAPAIECRPQSENPACVGACDELGPHCPIGYTPVCSEAERLEWRMGVDGCYVPARSTLSCTAGGALDCSGRAVCLAHAMGCGSVDGW